MGGHLPSPLCVSSESAPGSGWQSTAQNAGGHYVESRTPEHGRAISTTIKRKFNFFVRLNHKQTNKKKKAVRVFSPLDGAKCSKAYVEERRDSCQILQVYVSSHSAYRDDIRHISRASCFITECEALASVSCTTGLYLNQGGTMPLIRKNLEFRGCFFYFLVFT